MPYVKGQSGNPGGRPGRKLPDGRTLVQLAREHTEEALATLVEIMTSKSETGSARVAAATQVLNRGWGQAPQSITLEDSRAKVDLSRLSSEQVEALAEVRMLLEAQAAAPPPEMAN